MLNTDLWGHIVSLGLNELRSKMTQTYCTERVYPQNVSLYGTMMKPDIFLFDYNRK